MTGLALALLPTSRAEPRTTTRGSQGAGRGEPGEPGLSLQRDWGSLSNALFFLLQ